MNKKGLENTIIKIRDIERVEEEYLYDISRRF